MTKASAPESATGLNRWLDGYKTYIAAAGVLACGILAHYGIEVPLYVWGALNALGLTGLRKAIQGSK